MLPLLSPSVFAATLNSPKAFAGSRFGPLAFLILLINRPATSLTIVVLQLALRKCPEHCVGFKVYRCSCEKQITPA